MRKILHQAGFSNRAERKLSRHMGSWSITLYLIGCCLVLLIFMSTLHFISKISRQCFSLSLWNILGWIYLAVQKERLLMATPHQYNIRAFCLAVICNLRFQDFCFLDLQAMSYHKVSRGSGTVFWPVVLQLEKN